MQTLRVVRLGRPPNFRHRAKVAMTSELAVECNTLVKPSFQSAETGHHDDQLQAAQCTPRHRRQWPVTVTVPLAAWVGKAMLKLKAVTQAGSASDQALGPSCFKCWSSSFLALHQKCLSGRSWVGLNSPQPDSVPAPMFAWFERGVGFSLVISHRLRL
jgi:hypothetical protein